MLNSVREVNLNGPQKVKVGIITILGVNNYGAELQAFALQQKLIEMGTDAEIIDYVFYKNPKYRMEKAARPFPVNRVKNQVRDFILLKIDQIGGLLYPKIAKVRKERFISFHKNWTKISRPFYSQSELYKHAHAYDTFVVGSDQVWNPNNGVNIEPYFLTFAPKEKKKISFASSFGVEKISPNLHEFYRKMLLNLDSIAVRESSGVKLVSDIAGKKAVHVVDPTLLLTKEEWTKYEHEFPETEPYILVFVFKNSSFIDKVVQEISKRTSYKVYRICKNEFKVDKSSANIINLRDLGPAEFLGVYRKASFVITSSFHGTLFSLIFNIPFLTILPQSKDNNARQINLLELLNLKNRILFDNEEFLFDDNLFFEDFEKINLKVNNLRNESIKYLNESI